MMPKENRLRSQQQPVQLDFSYHGRGINPALVLVQLQGSGEGGRIESICAMGLHEIASMAVNEGMPLPPQL